MGLLGKLPAVALLAVLALPSTARAQETVEYYGLDALGSVRVIFDAQGGVVSRMDYGPFGENLREAIKFPTQQFAQLNRDAESGQDYAQARNYSAGTGRFNRVDPAYAGLFDPQRWNRYSYALNNPLTFIDPLGLNAASDSSSHCFAWGDDTSANVTCFNWGSDWGNGSGGGRNTNGATQNPVGGAGGRGRPAPTPSPGPHPGPTPGPRPEPDPRPENDDSPGSATILEQVRQIACTVIPSGTSMNLSGSLGLVAGTQGTIERSVDFNTGLVSYSISGGAWAGWGGAAQGSVGVTAVWGSANGSNDPMRTANFSVALVGVQGQLGNGTVAAGPSLSVNLLKIFPLSGSRGISVTLGSLEGGSVFETGSTTEMMLTVARSYCR